MRHYNRMQVSKKIKQRKEGDLSPRRAFLSLKLEKTPLSRPMLPTARNVKPQFVTGSWPRCLEAITDFVQQYWPK